MTTQTPQSFNASGQDGDPTLTGTEGSASVRERAGQVGGTAKDEAAGVAQEVKYQARDLVSEARTQVRQQVDTQKGRLSELLRDVGEELEQMAERSDRNGIASELARQAARRSRDARGYLDSGGDIVEDVRRFARRRPGTFLLGAVAAGVIAGRATRAAAAARGRQQSGVQDARSFAGTGSPGYAGEYGTYPTGGYGTTSAAPASGYGAPPTSAMSMPESAQYGTTAAGAGYQAPGGAAEYDDRLPGDDEPNPGYAAGYQPGAQPEYVTPAETLPPDREER